MHDVARQLLYVTRAPSKPLRKQLDSRDGRSPSHRARKKQVSSEVMVCR